MRFLLGLAASLLPFVNPFIGTGGHGHTFPGAVYPFGMMQLSPDTGCDGYHYSDSLIYGFSHTHLSGATNSGWCDILVMPATGIRDSVDRNEYASPFLHEKEHASPGYYEVFLEKPGVLARLTVGRRAGIHEYSFPAGLEPMLVIDLKHPGSLLSSELKMDKMNPYSIYGRRKSSRGAQSQDLFFYMEFSRPVISSKIDSTGAILHFRPGRNNNVLSVRVGISSVSCSNAKLNLADEHIASFNDLKLYTENEWENFLGTLDCPFEDDQRRTIFYTALYHCGIHPSLYSDVDGSYGAGGRLWNSSTFERYTVFSLWDTFRGFHPLMRELAPELTSEFVMSMLAISQEQGKLPVREISGCEANSMTGYHSAPVIADAILHGIPGIPDRKAFAALVSSSTMDEAGMDSFRGNGCVLGDDESRSVSLTLEYAYDDWCVAQLARYMAGTSSDSNDAEFFRSVYEKYLTSAQYWRNVFDSKTGMMRARYNGHWARPFDPDIADCHYAEGKARQYSFFVPHDLLGLMRAMGGPAGFRTRLDSLFTTGRYAHDDRSSMHIPYLYALAGKPGKTGALVDSVMTRFYKNAPDGLCGNDGCGQLSAWYVLSALGKYPVCPANTGQEKTFVPKTIVVNPVFEMESDLIEDSLAVSISNIDPEGRAYYSIGGGEFRPYSGPFMIYGPDTLKCYSENLSGKKSFTVQSIIRKKPSDISILKGDEMLIDGLKGSANWQAGNWLRIEGKDFEAVVDLHGIKNIHELSIGLCHDMRAGIRLPDNIKFLASNDGVNWIRVFDRDFEASPQLNRAFVVDACAKSAKGFYAGYVKVEAKNSGTFMIDEISIR